MANILQVTQPAVPNNHHNGLDASAARGQAESQQIQNPVDPSRVVRADGQSANGADQGKSAMIDPESNYGAFIQKLTQSPGLVGLLDQLFMEDKAGYLLPDQGIMSILLDQLRASIQMESPQQLLDFFMEQEAMQTKFSGGLFQNLRNLLTQNTSENLKNAIMAFLKGYNDYSSGTHLLSQMRSTADIISSLMLSQFRDQFQGLTEQLNWNAMNGDTEGNTQLLNNTLIPFLSNYISRTHDYGTVRDAVMHFIFQAVRYENGSASSVEQLLDRLLSSREFVNLYEGDIQADLDEALQSQERSRMSGSLADNLSRLLEGGSKGAAGLENVQQYYNAFQGFLLNESVYMPLLHMVLPFTWDGTDVMSEIWIDPDAKKEKEEAGRKIKMFFKFHIQQLGDFDMALEFQDRKTDLQLYVPPSLQSKSAEIQKEIGGILKNNNMIPSRLLVQEKRGELRVTDVFPEIREKEKTINVRV